ncbi:8-amino-7-oxononanoate synthase [Alkalihalobacillus deserti]|uniref:8-amino-7-oxononanoate synthase n=1 Tax=Alkalihalobacillus deserti TaxID=2879466 RepID=UPI001D140725|nr:8-amino-7-oxononanoate synthase [Alkalihalobacillus deserti]
MYGTFDSWLSGRVNKIKEKGLHRTFNVMNSAAKPRMEVNGRKVIVFSSNNYLGLASDERLIYAAESILHEFGMGSSGSRLTTGNTRWHETLEKRIASFKQTEAALLFSSGYLANVGVLSTLPEKGDVILSDELNHASIIDGCRLSKAKTIVYKHGNMDDLETKLKEIQMYQRCFIVTDGVFSMDGDLAPLDKIMSLAKTYHAYVIVDDAHGTGVLGERGRGTSEHFDVKPDVMIGTLSKAVGTEGGFVAGSSILIDFLMNQARTFIFQTAIPPSVCAASYAAIDIIENDRTMRNSLKGKVNLIKNKLTELGYHVKGDETPIIPVIIGGAEEAVWFSKRLEEYGIFAPAIRPPTVNDGESRIRLTVTAEHSIEDIDQLISAFKKIDKVMEVMI